MDHSITGRVLKAVSWTIDNAVKPLVNTAAELSGLAEGVRQAKDKAVEDRNPYKYVALSFIDTEHLTDTLMMAGPLVVSRFSKFASSLSGEGETVSLFRKMSTTESKLTLETNKLQPPIAGTDSSKYLSESLEKVQIFQNQKTVGSQQEILEFVLDKKGYDSMMSTSVKQYKSGGIDAIKYHFEGISKDGVRNIGVPVTKQDEFNLLIRDIRKVIEK
jgi:hypothetical protein